MALYCLRKGKELSLKITEDVFVVMATADEIEWPVAVYFEEKLAQMHTHLAARKALELYLVYGCKFKTVPLKANPWDEDMYSEDGAVGYYYTEVPIGKLQVEALKLELVGGAGYLPKEGDVGIQVQISWQGTKDSDAVRECGARSSEDVVQSEELGRSVGNVQNTLESMDAGSSGKSSSGTDEGTVYDGEIAGDHQGVS